MKAKEFFKVCKDCGAVGAWFCLLTTIFLFIGAALCPPKFIIDSSILAAGGILFAFTTLWKAPALIMSIEKGKELTLTHGETSITVSSKDADEEKEKEKPL